MTHTALSEWMETAKVSDETLADATGVDRSTISRVRRGKLQPSRGLIERIVRFSDRQLLPGDFFDLDAPPSSNRAA